MMSTLARCLFLLSAAATLCSGCKQDSSAGAPAASSAPVVAPPPSQTVASALPDADAGAPQITYLDDVRATFGKEHSCPEDRVHVTLRPEIDGLQFHKRSAKPLSAEVKADPERYAKWKADDAEDEAWHGKYYSDSHVFDVSGCNITELQECTSYRGSRGGRIPGAAKCQVVKLPPADAGARR